MATNFLASLIPKAINTLPKIASNVANQLKSMGPAATTPPPTLPSLYGGGGGGAAAPVYAPKLDIAATQAKARAAAEGAVNPYYTKQLTEFLEQQAARTKQRQELYNTNLKNIDDNLAQTLQDADKMQERTTQDVTQNLDTINQNTEDFQVDSGQEFDKARLDLARQTSTGGLGAQKNEEAQAIRNTTEGRQAKKFQVAKEQQQLFKTRTFEDLATKRTRSKDSAGKAKEAEKFDLDNYIFESQASEKNTRNSLEQDRLQAIAREQGNQAKLLFNQYLAGIKDPAKLQAAVGTYGGAF